MKFMTKHLHVISFALVLSLCMIMVAVADTSDFTFTLNSNGDGYAVTGYTGGESSITVPDWYNGLPVNEIGDGAFQNNQTLNSVTLPNSIKRIGERAFAYCSALSKMSSYNPAEKPTETPAPTPTETPAEPTETPRVPGDVTGDGRVNSLDTLTIARVAAGQIEVDDPSILDVNKDGKINSLDKLILSRYIAGQITWDQVLEMIKK